MPIELLRIPPYLSVLKLLLAKHGFFKGVGQIPRQREVMKIVPVEYVHHAL
jgi:hypothetical protein